MTEKKEVIDFRLARSESGAEWSVFLTDLINRGLAQPEVICADGGEGLISILPGGLSECAFSTLLGSQGKGTSLTGSEEKAGRSQERLEEDICRRYAL